MYSLIKKQHGHFGLTYNGPSRRLDYKEKEFYVAAFNEEQWEYIRADNLEDELDALIDLIVFALGACQRHGFDAEGALKAVVDANMKKELGPIDGKREEFQLDLRKPEGWKPADLKPYLREEQLALPGFEHESTKYDDGKPPVHLVDKEIILELAKVMGYGASKYTANNWRKGINFSRYYSACMRHLLAWNAGETLDEESGLNHLSHAAANIQFLLHFSKYKPELDDRGIE